MTYPNERIPEFVRTLVDDSFVRPGRRGATLGRGDPQDPAGPGEVGHPQDSPSGVQLGDPGPELRLRAFRRDVVAALPAAAAAGFSCVTTITLAFLSNQHDIKYVPIDYAKLRGPRSSTS